MKSTGVKRIPRLFSRLKGINQDIAQKTASFIVGIAKWYDVDVIVFEHLDLQGKKHGRMKQRLHHWKAYPCGTYSQSAVHRGANCQGGCHERVEQAGGKRGCSRNDIRLERGKDSKMLLAQRD